MSENEQPTEDTTDNVDEATETNDGAAVEESAADANAGREKTYNAADIDRIVEKRLERERAKYADYDKIKSEAKELAKLRDSERSELQKALERAEEAEKRIVEVEYEAMRTRVAASKGVPAASLTGSTEDELIASADELIAWRDQNAATKPPTPAPAAKRNGSLKSGASGNENTNPDPKAAAAEALRRLRAGV